MKCLVLFLPLLAAALAYTDLSDKFVVDTMLSDKDKANKEIQELTACLLDEGPCNSFNAAAKSHVVTTLADGCAQCDLVQKRGAVIYLKSLKNDFPDQWTKFEKRYDPDGTKYENMVNKLSVYD